MNRELCEEPGATCESQRGSSATHRTDAQVRPAQRECKRCGLTKPIEQFPKRERRYTMHTCNVCYLAHRRDLIRAMPPEQKAIRQEAHRREWARRKERESDEQREKRLELRRQRNALRRGVQKEVMLTEIAYKCAICLKTRVYSENARCQPCGKMERRTVIKTKEQRQARDIQYAAHEAKTNRDKLAIRREKDPSRYIQIGDGEWLLAWTKCGICRKPIVLAGRCYVCATGRPRTIFRKDEVVTENVA